MVGPLPHSATDDDIRQVLERFVRRKFFDVVMTGQKADPDEMVSSGCSVVIVVRQTKAQTTH